MTLDLLESPVHVLTLQRASNEALMVLQDPPDYNEEGRVMFRKVNIRNDPMGNQPDAWHTVKGEEDGFSLAVAARKSTAKRIIYGEFHHQCATYKKKRNGHHATGVWQDLVRHSGIENRGAGESTLMQYERVVCGKCPDVFNVCQKRGIKQRE